MKKRLRIPPYWLVGVEEVCIACGARFAHAVERRCAGCDRPICPSCGTTTNDQTNCSTDCEDARPQVLGVVGPRS